jgi:septum formation protein
VPFEVVEADVDEVCEGEPARVAELNATRKARAVAARVGSGSPVLGADTVVEVGGRLLPKPGGPAQAREWLELLSGREHRVVSAVCVVDGSAERTASSTTAVRFRDLRPEEVDWYVDGGEWRDRAGGYAIQGRGAALVASISGDYSTVVGLPVAALLDLLGPGLLTRGTVGFQGP